MGEGERESGKNFLNSDKNIFNTLYYSQVQLSRCFFRRQFHDDPALPSLSLSLPGQPPPSPLRILLLRLQLNGVFLAYRLQPPISNIIDDSNSSLSFNINTIL